MELLFIRTYWHIAVRGRRTLGAVAQVAQHRSPNAKQRKSWEREGSLCMGIVLMRLHLQDRCVNHQLVCKSGWCN